MGSFVASATALGLAGVLATAMPAAADQLAVDTAIVHLEDGTLAAGDAALAAMVESDPGNDDARFGLGAIRFLTAIEHLSQSFYRYGLRSPRSLLVPIMRLPVPVNPTPEPISYRDFRRILEDFVADLGKADATLAAMGAQAVKLPLDLAKVGYDADGDGAVTENERLIRAIAVAFGPRRYSPPATLTVAFDRGDALWLRGYTHLLAAIGEFLLAYDWHESFDASFQFFFPKIDSAFARALAADKRGDFAPIADVITFLHLRWPVAEPARMAAVRDHLKQVVALSRQSWDAILAETDDDREWLPNPDQAAAVTLLRVDTTQLAAWRELLDLADDVLDGKILVPHWRLERGINLRRVFDDPRPFDFVLWITGPAALPYLDDGKVLSSDEWRRLIGAFRGSFGTYAFWFN